MQLNLYAMKQRKEKISNNHKNKKQFLSKSPDVNRDSKMVKVPKISDGGVFRFK